MSSSIEDKKKEIREEKEKLKYEYKVELPKRIAEARAFGDLKENAEYHAARERHSFVKARISQLNEHLSQLNEIDKSKIPKDKSGLGSTITIFDLDDEEEIEYTLVTPAEVDPNTGKLSTLSPIGKALNNRSSGEKVEVDIPAGKKRFQIKKIITIHGNEVSGA